VGDLEEFLAERRRLFAIAYRMLGSVADADDVLQDAFLRWTEYGKPVDSPRSLLTTMVVRLCLDQLGSARARHVDYVGSWLPEPLLASDTGPAEAAELADSLSMAFLVLLEELAPAERAAFLLHDVFGYGYPEIAAMLDRQEPAARQMIARARHRIGERRRRFDADLQQGQRLATQFLTACATGDLEALISMLADDVVIWQDSGGKARAARNPIYGASKAARFLIGTARTVPASARVSLARLNGQPGAIITESGRVTTAIVLDILDHQVTGIRIVVNPDKLSRLQGPEIATHGKAPATPPDQAGWPQGWVNPTGSRSV
jgi:RNA polymerase sigma-70 factor, ECF subfamily